MSEHEPSEDTLCAALRSKKYFFLQAPPRSAEDLLDGSQHVWCNETMQTVGPDRLAVDPDDCCKDRSCYRSTLRFLA